ncbi:hypothetical protein QTO34_014363 [Cnephaeus nilssonii]|uniref:Uncharacterized protein n=1 Tax=Cnephaeus nilssonii TaxID=3371016 RepID=A0AA40I686_CNENI|nr:hypothetical protein QTO34_014363 [Eptesicus nilssonii]
MRTPHTGAAFASSLWATSANATATSNILGKELTLCPSGYQACYECAVTNAIDQRQKPGEAGCTRGGWAGAGDQRAGIYLACRERGSAMAPRRDCKQLVPPPHCHCLPSVQHWIPPLTDHVCVKMPLLPPLSHLVLAGLARAGPLCTMGSILSQRIVGVEDIDFQANSAYCYLPKCGNYFDTHFLWEVRSLTPPHPKGYLFGGNLDLNFLGNRPVQFLMSPLLPMNR